MSNWQAGSEYFGAMPESAKMGGGAFGGADGGDVWSTNANRAFAWFIAGIVGSVIVSIIFMIMSVVFGIGIGIDFKKGATSNVSPAVLIIAFVLSIGVGFAVAGSVYEGWVGCQGSS
jgi:hypothetical protein